MVGGDGRMDQGVVERMASRNAESSGKVMGGMCGIPLKVVVDVESGGKGKSYLYSSWKKGGESRIMGR